MQYDIPRPLREAMDIEAKACARIADDYARRRSGFPEWTAEDIARAIRARITARNTASHPPLAREEP